MTSLFRAKRNFDASDDKAFDDKKRKRILSASEEEDSRGAFSSSKYCSDLPMSKIYNSSFRNNKPAELFRKDLISAMKLPDTDQLMPDDYWVISDTWKPEWERGVQVPVNPNAMPTAVARCSRKKEKKDFKLPKKYLKCTYDKFFSNEVHVMSTAVTQAEKVCRYDLDDIDVEWLKILNEELEYYGLSPVDETSIELLIEAFESESFNNYQKSRKKDGIEFDEDVICDVCRSPDTEEGNEMVFCDSCNICVHQACYGITSIPEGSWLCCTCALGIEPPCILCPCRGGAMKSTRNGQKWAHVSCALWIPEVTIGCVERMEPITKVSMIPVSRWQLVCSLCKEKNGACIQCSVKTCKTAYHVTCAFEHGLEMKAIIAETEEDGIKLKSFCRKHSKQKDNSSESDSESSPRKKRRVKRELNMSSGDKKTEESTRYVASEFFSGISISSVADLLKIDLHIVDFVFQYWKLKRKANFNRPLLMPKVEELNVLGKNDEDYAKMKMFVHLRQDLERVRNLCYMVGRREKLFRSWSRVKEEIFHKQVSVMCDSPSLTENEKNTILHANHGDSLYDKFYTDPEDGDMIPSISTSISILEGTFNDSSENKLTDKKFVRERSRRLPNPYAKKYLNAVSNRIQKRQSIEAFDTNKHNKSRRRSGGLGTKDEDNSIGFSDFKSYFAERSGLPHLSLTEKCSAHSEKDDTGLQKYQDDNKKGSSNHGNSLTRRLRYAKNRGCHVKDDNINYISNKSDYRNKSRKRKTGGNKIYGRYSRFKSLPLSKRLTRSSLRAFNKCRIKQKFRGRKINLQKTLVRKRMDLRSKLLNSSKNKHIVSNDKSAQNNKIEERNVLKEGYSKENSDEEENHLTKSSLNINCSSSTMKIPQTNRCLRSSRSLETSSNNWEETGKETRNITRRQKELCKIEEMSRELESTNITVKTEVEEITDQKTDYEIKPNICSETKPNKLKGNDAVQGNCDSSFLVGDVFVSGIEEKRIFTRSCKVDKSNNFEVLPRSKTRRSSASILNETSNSTLCRKSQRISDQQVLSENNAKLIPLNMRRRQTLKFLSVPCYPNGEENAFNFIPQKEKDDSDVCKEENKEPVHTTDSCSGAVLTAYRTSRKLRNNYINKEDTENKERNSTSSHDSSPQRTGLRCSPRNWNYSCPLSSPSPLNGDEDIQSPRLVIRLRKDPNFPDCARWQRDSEFDSKSPDDISDDTDKQMCKINRHINSENRSLHPPDMISSDIGSKENGSRYLMRCRTLIKKNGLSRIN